MTSISKTEQLIQFLNEQLTCYQALLGLAKQQKDAIVKNDDEQLFKIVDKKNPFVKKVYELDQQFTNVSNSLSEKEKDLLSKNGEDIKKRIVSSIESLITIEEECANSLSYKKEETYELLKEYKKRKTGLKGYKSF